MSVVNSVGGRKLFSFALMAILVGSTVGGVLWYFGGTYVLEKQALMRFSSYQELIDFMKAIPQNAPQSIYQKLLSCSYYFVLNFYFFHFIFK